MAENKQLVVYAAAYETVEAALADLDAIEQLHKDEMIGQYDRRRPAHPCLIFTGVGNKTGGMKVKRCRVSVHKPHAEGPFSVREGAFWPW